MVPWLPMHFSVPTWRYGAGPYLPAGTSVKPSFLSSQASPRSNSEALMSM